MMDEDYLHLEKGTNLGQLSPCGFTLSVIPIMWIGKQQHQDQQ